MSNWKIRTWPKSISAIGLTIRDPSEVNVAFPPHVEVPFEPANVTEELIKHASCKPEMVMSGVQCT
jgi:hypothetical protein